MMRARKLLWSGACLCLFTSQTSLAQTSTAQTPTAQTPTARPATPSAAGTITGRVLDLDGGIVTDATLELVDLRRRTRTDAEGAFRLDGVPPGSYLLSIDSLTAGSAVERVTVAAGAVSEVEIHVALARHEDEIVVTGTGDPRSQLELAQPTEVLSGEELGFRLQASLGETLAQQPGITSTFFGAGASRPVIRGIGGDRVRMLQGGLDAGDVSSTSPDHAVSIEPALAERIEVLRGPATLLYGSSAIGGVVNVIDNRVPAVVPESRLGGFVELRGSLADEERSAILNLDGGAGAWGWHADALTRETDDYDIPGFAVRDDPDEDNPFGTLPNSDLESQSANVGLSHFFGDAGFLGVAVSGLDSEYGIPGGAHGEEEGEEEEEGEGEEEHGEEQIRIDLQRRRVDLRGEVTRPFGAFRGMKLRFGTVDYEHAELEGETREVGTTFFNDSWEGRLEFVQQERGRLSGSLGLQASRRDLEAVGEEAFIPPATTTSWAFFAFEEIEVKSLLYQLGVRYESQDTDNDLGLPARSFDGLSGSFGVVWLPGDETWSLGASLARSVKMPNIEELYSDGPHFATRAFELGDPNLGKETSLGFDLELRKKTGRLTGEVGVFVNRFDDYIFEAFTGEEEDGLPVVAFGQSDAEFRGLELEARYGLWESGTRHLDLEVVGDYVRAELRATGEALPRIPPLRLGGGLHFHSQPWHAYAEVRWVDAQDRVAANETETDSYTLVGAGVSYRLILGQQVYDVLLRGRNLTDEEARNHVSFLKDSVPLPGRDLSLSLRVTF